MDPPGTTSSESSAPAKPTPSAPTMCYACGQMLKGTEEKCPSCGAPIRTLRRSRRPGALTISGVIFIGLAVLIGANAVAIILAPDQAIASGQNALLTGEYAVTGTVTDEAGAPINNVTIELVEQPERSVQTDPNGTYQFRNLTVGGHTLRFLSPNRTAVQYRVLLLTEDAQADVKLTTGTGTQTLEDPLYQRMSSALKIAGYVIMAGAFVILASAIACFRRRPFFLPVIGAVVSILFSLLYLPVVLLGLVALVLVLRNRRSFV